ncbi:hypothetical protein EJ04DRAFT_550669 [Polyplosphaeria fusca]|uniref:Uncharacterized protein n=1 Tax=Polyplosphaeria fusca TaxID=682080 RepID=A0A9P4R376_9PLEO|nr:hypothetical protein EJ04DRAFT_550669 [Polyplosphaeria fusca]
MRDARLKGSWAILAGSRQMYDAAVADSRGSRESEEAAGGGESRWLPPKLDEDDDAFRRRPEARIRAVWRLLRVLPARCGAQGPGDRRAQWEYGRMTLLVAPASRGLQKEAREERHARASAVGSWESDHGRMAWRGIECCGTTWLDGWGGADAALDRERDRETERDHTPTHTWELGFPSSRDDKSKGALELSS